MTRIFALFIITLSLTACGGQENSASDASATVGISDLALSSTGSGNVDIAWQGSEDSEYTIFRRSSGETKYKTLAVVSGTTYQDDDIQVGETYTYQVVAGDGSTVGIAKKISVQNCLTKANVRALKAAVSDANAATLVGALYSACGAAVEEQIGIELSSEERAAVFATYVSHMIAAYGGSQKSSLMDLLSEDDLDCDNYGLLVGHIFELIVGAGHAAEIVLAGFDDGAVGNHAQVVFKGTTRSLLLDPTVGIVAITSYDDLLAGKPLSSKKIFSFYAYWDDDDQPEALITYHWRIYNALRLGSYRAADFLYYMVRQPGFGPL